MKSIYPKILLFEQLGSSLPTPPWGAGDAEIKVPSVENAELKGSLFKAGVGQYVAMHTYYTYRLGFLPC